MSSDTNLEVEIEEDIREQALALLEMMPATLPNHLGIAFRVLSRERVIATMPVDARTQQPFGLLHGGASVALAETLASIGAWFNIDYMKFAAVGIEINANHLRGVSEGIVIGTATPLHRGSTTQVWEIKIVTEAGKLVCASRCTMAILPLRTQS
jgi:1,4-dihydroxy-2-naphthoyl-CoA hydrolase